MSNNSKIEWTDATWNPFVGCSKTSPGCKNCYAIRQVHRMASNPNPKIAKANEDLVTHGGGNWLGVVRFLPERIDHPLHWRNPRRVFVNSLSDMFHRNARFEDVAEVWLVMRAAKQHTFQILTKHPARMAEFIRGSLYPDSPLPNVWLGCSVEDQQRADERREALEEISALGWNTFVSYEPALGPVDWQGWEFTQWLISGGESGPYARPSHPDWHRAARDFCLTNAIPFFFKQWGEWQNGSTLDASKDRIVLNDGRVLKSPYTTDQETRDRWSDYRPHMMAPVGKKKAGRLLHGREWNEFPKGVSDGQ